MNTMTHVRANNDKAAQGTVRMLKTCGPGPADRFLDIGANVLYVSNWAAEQGCVVRAYEPMPMTNAISSPAPGVTLVQRAVTADGRDIAMQISKEALDRGYLCSAHISRRPNSSAVEVANIRSDSIASILNDFKPSVVKIDIEGGEYEILPVADLSDARALFVEFHGCASTVESVMLPMVMKRLHNQGFTPTHGWALNPRFDPRYEFKRLMGIGFWREVMFAKGTAEVRGLSELLDGVKRILDGGEFPGPRGRCSQEAFDNLVKETL